jgi:hypothetical protein
VFDFQGNRAGTIAGQNGLGASAHPENFRQIVNHFTALDRRAA